ncbi:MAG: hypothetical protein J6D25_02670, partial [Eggerthellaceae bacterium]|nr:hypothetical protein [Eggerthellaceae bacterium]
MARYRAQLEQAGLVEVGWAAAYLAAHRSTVFPRAVSVLVAQASPLSWQMAAFFDACEQLDVCVDEAPGAAGIGPVAAGVELRFGFPSGRYAQPALVADLLHENAGQVSSAGASAAYAVVACKDPLAFYKQLEVTLAQNGFAGCVQAQVSFSSTDFGRRFLALGRVVGDDQWAKVDLSDAVVPPFAGFDKTQALQVDRELRGNRLARRDECLESLRQASDTFSQFEELVGDPEADVLLGVFEQIAFTSPARSDAWRHEQLTAAAAVRSCTKAARAVCASMKSCLRVLEDVSVTVSYEGMRSDAGLSAPAYAGRVVVTTQSVAAQMGEGACEVLVLCDLTSDDYPISDRDDAAATLFAKIGLLPADTMLAQARRRFTALQAVPAAQLVCVRPLNDYDGNPTYPAAMLQELVDAYMPEGSTSDDVDELFGLPATLMGSMVQRGEELLYANASAKQTGAKQAVAASVPAGMPGDMPPDAEARVMLPRLSPDGEVLAQVSPSPSQVEAYLECPYKWFAQRRLNIEELDEG